jgi:hypothetical protein
MYHHVWPESYTLKISLCLPIYCSQGLSWLGQCAGAKDSADAAKDASRIKPRDLMNMAGVLGSEAGSEHWV